MRNTLLATTLVVVALTIATPPAFAQDGDAFEGPWVAATAGYDTFNGDGSESADGIVYGIVLGYDFSLGGVFLGVEAELGKSSVSASGSDVLVTGDELSFNVGRDIYAGIRVGVPVSETVLAYGKAGYTNQRISATYTLDDFIETASDNIGGYRLGAGVEFDLGEPFARIEYRYSDYGSFSDTDLETSRHQVMLTAGLRF
jgi:outer membrane immunogenic protein